MRDTVADLPPGWVRVTLLEAAAPRGEKASPADHPAMPFIGMDHVEAHSGRIIGSVPASAMKSAAARFFAGDVLYGRLRPYLNKVAVPSFDGLASAEFIVFPDTDFLSSTYLAYRLRASDFVGFSSHLNEGDRPRVDFGQIGPFILDVPPLREQHRIVAKIEELFSELDNSVESLTLARRQCEFFMQTHLEKIFAGMKESRALPDLLAKPMTNGYSGKPVKTATPSKVLSLSATTSGVFLREHFKYLDEPGLERRDIWCEPGDILVQRGNTSEYVGVPAIYTGASREFIFPDLMIRLRADRGRIAPEYLCYALASPRIRNEMRTKAKGSAGTMPKISQKILSEIRIPYCDQEEQNRITQLLDEVGSRTQAVQDAIDEQALRINALRQSILKQAFSGQLVPQDPADEPAAALLARLRDQGSPARSRRRKTA